MLVDYAKCNWCDTELFISLEHEICLNCKREGFLIYTDENSLKMEVEYYETINK